MAVNQDILENMRIIIFSDTSTQDTYCVNFYALAENTEYTGPIIKVTDRTNGTPVLEELAIGTSEYETIRERIKMKPLVKESRSYFRDNKIIDMLREQLE